MKGTLEKLAHSIQRPRDAQERLYHLLLIGQENVYTTSYAYRPLATLLSAGYFSTIITTNMDTLLEQALDELGPIPHKAMTFGHDSEEDIATALDGQEKGIYILKLPPDENMQFVDEVRTSLYGYLQRNIVVVGYIDGIHHDVIQALTSKEDANTIYYILPDEKKPDVLIECMRMKYMRYNNFLVTGQDGEFVTFFHSLASLVPRNSPTFSRYSPIADGKGVPLPEKESKRSPLAGEPPAPSTTKEKEKHQAEKVHLLQNVNVTETMQPVVAGNQTRSKHQERKTRPLPPIESEVIDNRSKLPWYLNIESGLADDQLLNSGPLTLDAPLEEIKDATRKLSWPAEVDTLIVTVTDVELRAVLAYYPMRVRRRMGEKTYYDLGYVGQARTAVVQANDMGLLEAHTTVDEGIRALSPNAVIMTGIAFGVRTKGQQIGDILVSRLIHDYDSERIGTGADNQPLIHQRGTRVKATGWLIDRFNSGSHDWPRPPEIHFGTILSGSKLFDNQEHQNALLRSVPDAIGGEMEGVGLLKAAEHHRVGWLLVKGISDWGDGTKGENKEDNQQRAAENAARFVLFVIGQEDFMHKS